MQAKLTANGLPHDDLFVLAGLLNEARCIEHDVAGRLAQYPTLKSLLKQHNEYQELAGRLTCEFERALASYLPRIKADMRKLDSSNPIGS